MEKPNYIKLENKKGLKKEYRVLLKIEAGGEKSPKTYLVYTDDRKDKFDTLITYVTLIKNNKFFDPSESEIKIIKKILNPLIKEQFDETKVKN